jgi:hypothetical protein
LAVEEAPGGGIHRNPLAPERQDLKGSRSVAPRGIAALEEGLGKPLLVHTAVFEEGLGEHDHHLGVVGVSALAPPRLDHLRARGDGRSCQPLVRHAESVTDERAQEGPGRRVAPL